MNSESKDEAVQDQNGMSSDDNSDEDSGDEASDDGDGLVDMEDLGKVLKKGKSGRNSEMNAEPKVS